MSSIRLAVGVFGVFVFALLIAVSSAPGSSGATVRRESGAPAQRAVVSSSGAPAPRAVVSFGSQAAVFPEVGLATADLSVFKSASANPVSTGSAFSYQVTIVNDGPDDADAVVMTDTLPPGVTAGMVTSSQGSCAPPTGTVTCTLGTIPAFDLATVDIAVTAPATTGVITNSATVTTTDTDPDPSNNTATVETTVVDPGADLAIGNVRRPGSGCHERATYLHAAGHEPRAGRRDRGFGDRHPSRGSDLRRREPGLCRRVRDRHLRGRLGRERRNRGPGRSR